MIDEMLNDLVLECVLNVLCVVIWCCWIEFVLIWIWFCFKLWYVLDVWIDLWFGGEFFIVMNGFVGEWFENLGVFLDIVLGEWLIFIDVFVFGWCLNGKFFMIVSIVLLDIDDGCIDYVVCVMYWNVEIKV